MDATTNVSLNVSRGELAILTELLEAARVELLVERRHTYHRSYRDYLRERLTLLEHLIDVARQVEDGDDSAHAA